MNQTLQFLTEKLARGMSQQTDWPTEPKPYPILSNLTPRNDPHPQIETSSSPDLNPDVLNTLQTLVNENTAEKGNWKTKKLDQPNFNGENPDRWIVQAKRYFQFYELSEKEVMEVAVLSLVGMALLWYQWEHQQ